MHRLLPSKNTPSLFVIQSFFLPQPKMRTIKKFGIAFLAPILLGIVAGVVSSENSDNAETSPEHAVLKSSCSNTFYPELCYSAVATVPGAAESLASQKDVIEMSINLTKASVEKTSTQIQNILATGKMLTTREKVALHDCLEMMDETLLQLNKVIKDLHNDPTTKHADDLKTFMSAAMTNQESCLDGFSHDAADREVRKSLLSGQEHVEKMCSNSLAMICNITGTDSEIDRVQKKLLQSEDGNEWPEWLKAGDRKLLQSSRVMPNVVVAADGSGDYTTVSAAVEAAPSRSTTRYIIRIKAGVYRENVDVPSSKTYLMFLGDGRLTTIITGSRNVVDGSTTFDSATVAAVGANFLARDITFQNSAGASKHQAVALRVGSDLSAFYRCSMIAYQDTLYVHSNRQFYRDCYIAGTVDFIFGNAAAVLQNCDIHARKPDPKQRNMFTASGRTDPNQNTGIVIQKCRIGATSDLLAELSTFESYLGRPWKEYARTVVMQSSISEVIHPAGWYPWDGDFALDTLYYAEYENTGAGANTSQRVTWNGYNPNISTADAQGFTAGSLIAGGSWLGSTGFPYDLGL